MAIGDDAAIDDVSFLINVSNGYGRIDGKVEDSSLHLQSEMLPLNLDSPSRLFKPVIGD